MQEYFYSLADELTGRLSGGEAFLASYSGEDSTFVRFNRSLIRQPGSVRQRYFSLNLIAGRRHVKSTITLTGERGIDGRRLAATLDELRAQLPHVQEDPYLLYNQQVQSTTQVRAGNLPDDGHALAAIDRAGAGRDMVGIYAAGDIHSGFANSAGQRNWFSAGSFHMDWCFYHAADKAVKASYAGFEWDQAAFDAKARTAGEQLAMLSQPPKTIQPGKYRAYLAPSALDDILGTMSWGGFGLKAHRTKFTPLLKMIQQGATLSPAVTISENTADGIAPNFQSQGFIKPPSVTMIDAGKFSQCLVSPRSASEYSAATNGANSAEMPESLDMAGGQLAHADIMRELDTGVYVNQLWYLNFSDRPGGRITGMTRFASFWVEGGQIVAPLNVMRFDDTIYNLLGENLLALTSQREFTPSASTYGGRSTSSIRLPGALVKDMAFTL